MKWWRRLLNKTELERSLDAELRFHFDQQVADNIRAGMKPDEARRIARLKFGTLEHMKEECRDARGARWIENTLRDARFTLRTLRRSPAFTIVAVLCLALGIGANTAIFSVMDALMLRTLPVKHPEQLLLFGDGLMSGVTDDFPHKSQQLFSQPFYREMRGRNDVFSNVAAMESMSGDVHARFGAGESGRLSCTGYRVNDFEMLGPGRLRVDINARRRSCRRGVRRSGDAFWLLETTLRQGPVGSRQIIFTKRKSFHCRWCSGSGVFWNGGWASSRHVGAAGGASQGTASG